MLDSHSPRLLQDIFDSVIDHLRDEKEALSQCCLVSKSWVPLNRKYLFFRIRIFTSRSLDRWSKACQNEPAPRQAGTFSEWLLMNPPASYVRALEVDGAYGGRIRMPLFSRVEKLFVECGLVGLHDGYHLIPFGELAGSLKSLRVDCLCGTPHSQVFGLIHSLPGLEDLTLSGNDKTIEQDRSLDIFPPSTPIALTGALGLCLRNIGKSIRLLLDLQGGLHFKKLTLRSRCTEENFPLVEKLLKACSDTLECLDIECTIENGTLDSVSLFDQTLTGIFKINP